MAQYRDYQAPAVGQAKCTYSSLSNVYGGRMAGTEAVKQNDYIVPKLCPSGPRPNYPPKKDTLTHGQDYLCGGYFSMSGAYPLADCGPCQCEYVTRPCSGNIKGICDRGQPVPAAVEAYRRRLGGARGQRRR